MAIINKLRRDTTDLNLNAGEGGLQQAAEGCIHKIATPIDGRLPSPILQPITLELKDTSHDNLTVDLQALAQMQVWAEQYMKDPTVKYPVWWHSKLDGETGERRAMVRRIDAEFLRSWHGGDATAFNMPLAAAFLREPWWEQSASRSLPQYSPPAGIAVVYDYTAAGSVVIAHDIAGDVPARISYLGIQNTLIAPTLDRFWMGLRSANRHGDLSKFVNIWECEDTDAVLGTDAARITDVTASPGGAGDTKVRITPGTATWAKRLSIRLDDIVEVDFEEQFGDFLWLLRHQVTAGTWEIQLRFGLYSMPDADFIRSSVIQTTATSWDVKVMGKAVVPFLLNKSFPTVSKSVWGSWTIQIWARRTSGTGNLDLDCLYPISIDEGYCIVSGAAMRQWDVLRISETPDRIASASCYNALTSWFGIMPPFEFSNFKLPPGDGRMYIVFARASSSDITDQIRVCLLDDGFYYECWSSLRGAE